MISAGKLRRKITFQITADNICWADYFECHAYMNGLSGNEFFIANAGYEDALVVEIRCRWCPPLMAVTPGNFRVICEGGEIYELISPPDDIMFRHKEIKFRARSVKDDV